MKEDYIFESAVNYAARLEHEAVGSEILLSDNAKSHIDEYRAKRHSELEWDKRPCAQEVSPFKMSSHRYQFSG